MRTIRADASISRICVQRSCDREVAGREGLRLDVGIDFVTSCNSSPRPHGRSYDTRKISWRESMCLASPSARSVFVGNFVGNSVGECTIDKVSDEVSDKGSITEAGAKQILGLCRPATRRTEREGHRQPMRPAFCSAQPRSFRSAGRRPARAGRPCHPFFRHALSPEPTLESKGCFASARVESLFGSWQD